MLQLGRMIKFALIFWTRNATRDGYKYSGN